MLESLKGSGALPAAVATLESGSAPPEAERLFTGKLIAALTALSEAAARAPLNSRDDQADVVLLAASIVGLTVFARAGRLKALGFDEQELIARLDRRFTKSRLSPASNAGIFGYTRFQRTPGRRWMNVQRRDFLLSGTMMAAAMAAAPSLAQTAAPAAPAPGPGEARGGTAQPATRPSSIPAAPR